MKVLATIIILITSIYADSLSDAIELEVKGNVYYEKFSTEPFTGRGYIVKNRATEDCTKESAEFKNGKKYRFGHIKEYIWNCEGQLMQTNNFIENELYMSYYYSEDGELVKVRNHDE